MSSSLRELGELGQSVWLDDLRRDYFADGTLAALIEQDGVSGITSNPAIFERAIRETDLYQADIERYARASEETAGIYEHLIIDDIRRAADQFDAVYRASFALDGYVSLEVSPQLAHDTSATIAEARRLWSAVERANLMIKVPGTSAGLGAIRALIAEGINVNVTLLFSPARYAQVIEAYWSGLDDRHLAGHSLERVASVASFFVSRIDTAVDRALEASPVCMGVPARGGAAVAAAANAYKVYRTSLAEPRWHALAESGAQPQRLLWASTGTKDPSASDVKYVESLIGPDTVTTLPMETLVAYRDHGDPRLRLHDALEQGEVTRRQLDVLGIDLEAVAEQLEREGVQKFIEPFERLLARIEAIRNRALAPGHGRSSADVQRAPERD